MEFGMFHEFPSLTDRADAAAFDDALEQVDAAERWGLDAMWLAELHFDPGRSVLSSPMPVAGAIAARTRRIKIGIAVQVLPLAHPLRLAEEAATIDQLSRGRLIFGIGRSGVVRTYENYGIPYAESRERFAEAFDIIRLVWTQPNATYRGRYHSFEDVSVMPRPYQRPLPDIRIAGSSADSFPAIGRLGFPIFVAVRHGSFSELVPQIRRYREAWEEAGHPGTGRVYLRVPAYLAETETRAREEPRDSIMHFFRRQAALARDSAARSGAGGAQGDAQAATRARNAERLETLSYEEALRTQVLYGDPERFSAQLRALQEELGLDGILAELNCGGLIPQRRVLTAIRLLCQEVMPRFPRPAAAAPSGP